MPTHIELTFFNECGTEIDKQVLDDSTLQQIPEGTKFAAVRVVEPVTVELSCEVGQPMRRKLDCVCPNPVMGEDLRTETPACRICGGAL